MTGACRAESDGPSPGNQSRASRAGRTSQVSTQKSPLYSQGDKPVGDTCHPRTQGCSISRVGCRSLVSILTSHLQRSQEDSPQFSWDQITKERMTSVGAVSSSVCEDSGLRKLTVYGKSPPEKLYFSNHHHVLVEKLSSMINNRTETLGQTRFPCFTFAVCFLLLYTDFHPSHPAPSHGHRVKAGAL